MWTLRYQLILLMAVAVHAAEDDDEQLERDEIIEAVNNAHTTWKAGRNFHPSLKRSYIKNLLGLKKQPGGLDLPVLYYPEDDSDIPEEFDARKKWPNCKALQEVRDQGKCGSCWAVSATSAFTDRLCIASNGSFNGHLAAEELISCCSTCSGCEGCNEHEAWKFFETNGVVTGGDYHSKEGCQPYTIPNCDRFVHVKYNPCGKGFLPTPVCQNVCYNKCYKEHTFKEDHHKVRANSSFQIQDIKTVQKEIFEHGPVVTGYIVYEDFMSYKTGVYHHKTGAFVFGHAVKVIGWGVENSTPYWLVANSWNPDWGDKGFFKFRRGHNDCGFEDGFVAGYPDV